MTYTEALKFLYDSLPMFHRVGQEAFRPGLGNIEKLCKHFGEPQESFPTIHIGGTNGKGSTSHLLAAVLQRSGYKTGLYTSPHLKNFTERIKIDGREISEDYVIKFIEDNKDIILEIKPSFFEVTVLMAFLYFQSNKIDVAVIEVGLGGRLDSTNIINPVLSLITNISLDHQNILGNSYGEIAYEKAGIIKENTPVVISERQDNVKEIFISTAAIKRAPICFASDNFRVEVDYGQDKPCFNIEGNDGFKLNDLKVGLGGSYQEKNILGVIQSVEILKEKGYFFPEAAIRDGIENVCAITGFMGRWQILQHSPTVIADTGHNEAGIKSIIDQVTHLKFRKLRWVFGVVKDKDVSSILDLLPKEAYYYFCQANIPRALPSENLYSLAKDRGLAGEVISDVKIALNKALSDSHPEDLILVGGSTFVVAEAL
ncbi:MAG TPA: folylpolyglutamate synthase/dihydrofolate synthase family protein [Cytophagaceae bacterium]|jgi:dihydrofolate synthase/folylpolyglutamate synthase